MKGDTALRPLAGRAVGREVAGGRSAIRLTGETTRAFIVTGSSADNRYNTDRRPAPRHLPPHGGNRGAQKCLIRTSARVLCYGIRETGPGEKG